MDGTEYAEVARAEGPRGEVVLRERRTPEGPAVLELRVNGVFVMDTRETGSERALARRALELVEDPRNVLVGGLGLGFTTREVLADPRVERVAVVEIEESLVGWMRDGTVRSGPELLADRRVVVVPGDIREALAEVVTRTYDLVLLDVDNGPGHLVHEDNRDIYREPFLDRVREILAPLGALVVWSSAPAPQLEAAMRAVFGCCERITYPVVLQEREEEYLLYLARKPGPDRR
ncbi:MAG: hypothetical protein ACRDPH_14420 [Marmoricola sp.]